MNFIYQSRLKILTIFFAVFLLIWCSSCSNNEAVNKNNESVDAQTITLETTLNQANIMAEYNLESNFEAVPAQNVHLPIMVFTPDDWEVTTEASPIATVIVVHGSGGLWEDDNQTIGEMSSQFDAWKDTLTGEGIITVFVESFRTRDIFKNSNLSVEEKLKISEQFIRPRDLQATVNILRQLVSPAGHEVVGNIALIGFSHGGSTVRNTVHDCSLTQNITEWSVSFDGISYTVPSPVCEIDKLDVTAVVSYYPGGYDRGYWGNPRKGESVYRNSVPMLVHLAENDELTSDTKDLIEKNLLDETEVDYYIYKEAAHSFDHPAVTGKDAEARILAQQRTLVFINHHLK